MDGEGWHLLECPACGHEWSGEPGKRRIAAALDDALSSLTIRPEDGATVALVRRYAADLDEASVVAATLAKALRDLRGEVDLELFDRFAALATRIEDTTVLGLLGPKLLAALTELGMTPRARAAVAGKGGAPGGADRAGAHPDDCKCLPCLRERRSGARQGGH
jgi:hypothetical protein